MTTFSVTPETTLAAVVGVLGDSIARTSISFGELEVVVPSHAYHAAMLALRDAPGCKFEQLIDLCGVDYSEYKAGALQGPRFCVVVQLLSVSLNQRLRLKVFAVDDAMPVVQSVKDVWVSADWYEREAFDLLGIMFDGHDDLRRILTDYGFVGHPLRKDFPTSGHVEMRYDAEQGRVVYQPVSIESREITPRIIREDSYGAVQ